MPVQIKKKHLAAVKFMYFDNLPDKELVELLQNADDDAWMYIFLRVVRSVVRGSTKNGILYSSILKDKLQDEEDVWHDLCREMIGRGKLKLFSFRCPLINWMRIYVENIILGYCKKNPSHESEERLKSISVNKAAVREIGEVVRVSFAELWRENPMRAYVFLLKSQECYSSGEIRDYLGLTSSNNVDQFYARAKKDLGRLVMQFSGEKQ